MTRRHFARPTRQPVSFGRRAEASPFAARGFAPQGASLFGAREAREAGANPFARLDPAGVQRGEGGREEVSSGARRGIQSALGNGGQGLPDGVRAPMERALGADFAATRIHTDARADELSRSVAARAFTVGRDVFFRQGVYDPQSTSGKRVLAHELTHVVQQGGASGEHSAPRADNLSLGQHNDSFEREADRTADAVMRSDASPAAPRAEASGPFAPVAARANAPVGRIQRVPPTWYGAAAGGPATWVKAHLKKNNLAGGSAATKTPVGLVSGIAPYGHQKGHLLGKQLGGKGNTKQNLVTLTQGTNSPKMRNAENALKAFVKGKPATGTTEYKVVANYGGKFQTGLATGVAFPAVKWIAPPAPSSVRLKAYYKGAGKKAAWVAVNSGAFANNMVIKNGQ